MLTASMMACESESAVTSITPSLLTEKMLADEIVVNAFIANENYKNLERSNRRAMDWAETITGDQFDAIKANPALAYEVFAEAGYPDAQQIARYYTDFHAAKPHFEREYKAFIEGLSNEELDQTAHNVLAILKQRGVIKE